MRPAIFLDRDNTLITNDGDLGDPARVRLREGVADGLRSLRQAGYSLIVVTNQGGVARGQFSEADVDAVHQRIAELVDAACSEQGLIERFYYCPYHPEGTVPEYQRDHPWRKPQPGMLLQAARDLELDLASSWMIGDQQRDIAAGRSAGCRTVLLSADKAMAEKVQPTTTVETFDAAVTTILGQTPPPPLPPLQAARSGVVGAQVNGSPAQRTAAAIAGASEAQRPRDAGELSQIHKGLQEVAEELRMARARRGEFTLLRMLAVGCQLLVLLLALLGLLQMAHMDQFLQWMVGAVLMQLLTIALLIMDARS